MATSLITVPSTGTPKGVCMSDCRSLRIVTSGLIGDRGPSPLPQLDVVLALIFDHHRALVLGHRRGLRQVAQQGIPINGLAPEHILPHQPGDQF